MCRVHSLCFACVLLTKRRLQKCRTPIRTGTLENTFFSICFKGKKSLHSRMLTCMAGYGSHKSGLLFNMKHSRQLNFYCLQHLLLGKRKQNVHKCHMCRVTMTSGLIYILHENNQSKDCLEPAYLAPSIKR